MKDVLRAITMEMLDWLRLNGKLSQILTRRSSIERSECNHFKPPK